MRIACLENVSRVQKITPDGRNLTCSPVNIKLNQEKEKLICAIVDRYNKNKEEVEKLRNKQSVDTSEECPICYDKLGDAVCTTKCGHKFCTDCFVQIIRKLPQGACCPMCRASLIPKPVDREAREAVAGRPRGPETISWSVDRNPDPARRLEFIDDREEEVGF